MIRSSPNAAAMNNMPRFCAVGRAWFSRRLPNACRRGRQTWKSAGWREPTGGRDRVPGDKTTRPFLRAAWGECSALAFQALASIAVAMLGPLPGIQCANEAASLAGVSEFSARWPRRTKRRGCLLHDLVAACDQRASTGLVRGLIAISLDFVREQGTGLSRQALRAGRISPS